MGNITRSLIGASIGGFVGILCLIPFLYALVHGGWGLLLVPLIFALIGSAIPYLFRSHVVWLKYLGYFFTGCAIILIVLILYYFVISPKLSSARIISNVTAIAPTEVTYTPISWSGKNIGISVQAKFTMNPDIQSILPRKSSLPELPWISLDPYSDGFWDGMNSYYKDGIFVLSGSALLPGLIYRDGSFCFWKWEYETQKLTEGIFTGNILYPYFEGACYRGWECFAQYEIPGTEFAIDIDPSVYTALPKCKI